MNNRIYCNECDNMLIYQFIDNNNVKLEQNMKKISFNEFKKYIDN